VVEIAIVPCLLAVLLTLLLTACAGSKNDLTYTGPSDPVWAVNPDQWTGPVQAGLSR